MLYLTFLFFAFRLSKNITMLKIDKIPQPSKEILETWQQYLQCPDIEFDNELLLKAYYFDVGFILGRQIDFKTDYLNEDNTFKTLLPTPVRQNLINAISIIKNGIRYPIFGDTDNFKIVYQSRLRPLN